MNLGQCRLGLLFRCSLAAFHAQLVRLIAAALTAAAFASLGFLWPAMQTPPDTLSGLKMGLLLGK